MRFKGKRGPSGRSSNEIAIIGVVFGRSDRQIAIIGDSPERSDPFGTTLRISTSSTETNALVAEPGDHLKITTKRLHDAAQGGKTVVPTPFQT